MTNVKEFLPIFSSVGFGLGLVSKYLIHFELIFVSDVRQGFSFYLYMWISCFPNIIWFLAMPHSISTC